MGSARRGIRQGSGREHVRQVRDGPGVPQVQVDPQEGGTRGARVAVRGGLHVPDAPVQRPLFSAPARARGWFGPGAGGHLGASRASVGADRHGGGHRVAFPAEVAGVWKVGGWQPGAEMAEPEVVAPLAKGFPEL